jgi:hypothetical protein
MEGEAKQMIGPVAVTYPEYLELVKSKVIIDDLKRLHAVC